MVAVAVRLGHESATLVLKTYGDLLPDSEDRLRRAIDAAWTKAATQAVRPRSKRPSARSSKH